MKFEKIEASLLINKKILKLFFNCIPFSNLLEKINITIQDMC